MSNTVTVLDDEQATRTHAAKLLGQLAGEVHRKKALKRRSISDLSVQLDVDTKDARTLQDRLLAQIGPKPTTSALFHVRRAIQLYIRLETLDELFRRRGRKPDSAHDNREYCAFSNAFTRTLREIDRMYPPANAEPPPATPSLNDYLASRASARAVDGVPDPAPGRSSADPVPTPPRSDEEG